MSSELPPELIRKWTEAELERARNYISFGNPPEGVNLDYTQPFWVGYNDKRFRYARWGYLPPLEYKPEPLQKKEIPSPEPRWRQTYRDEKVMRLQKQLGEMSQKPRKELRPIEV